MLMIDFLPFFRIKFRRWMVFLFFLFNFRTCCCWMCHLQLMLLLLLLLPCCSICYRCCYQTNFFRLSLRVSNCKDISGIHAIIDIFSDVCSFSSSVAAAISSSYFSSSFGQRNNLFILNFWNQFMFAFTPLKFTELAF